MIIGIDNISRGESKSKARLGGMRHYLEDLATALPALAPGHEFKLFSPEDADPLNVPAAHNLEVVNCPGVPRNRICRVLYEQFYLPPLIQRHRVSVWLGTCNVLPLALPCRGVLIVQSLQVFTFPEGFSWLRRAYLRAMVPASIRRADAVVALSKASKDEIVRRFGTPPDKVAVVYNFLSSSLMENGNSDHEVVKSVSGGFPYILCVSAFYQYKNLPRLLEAFARLKPEFPHRLVIVGGDGPTLKHVDLLAMAKQLNVEAHVVCPGRVPHSQVAAFYRYADLMVMPSLSETFGYPVLEAMALGCPVVTSNVSSMPEIAGDAAVLVDPYRVDSIANGMVQVLTNPARRQELVEAGLRRSAEFTWERTSQQILRILEEVCIR